MICRVARHQEGHHHIEHRQLPRQLPGQPAHDEDGARDRIASDRPEGDKDGQQEQRAPQQQDQAHEFILPGCAPRR